MATSIDLPTRDDYMSGRVSHEKYYRSVWQVAGIRVVGLYSALGPEVRRALAEGDEHLNTIQLSRWDAIAALWHKQISESLKRHGDSWSLAGGVCTVKQAAIDQERQVMREQKEGAKL